MTHRGRRPFTAEEFSRKFWERVNKSGGCWFWLAAVSSSGYGHVWNRGKMRGAHVVAYELTRGEVPEGLEVLHRCDTPLCCRPEHLYAGTQQRNARDMHERGRARDTRGEVNGRALLTAEDVLTIRASGEKTSILALNFGVNPRTVRDIRARRRWRHL